MRRTAAILLTLLTIAGPAQALIVSEKVGPVIKQAQSLAQAKHYKAALAKLNEAEAVKSNPDDGIVINQLRQFIAVSSSDQLGLPLCTSAQTGATRCDGQPAQP